MRQLLFGVIRSFINLPSRQRLAGVHYLEHPNWRSSAMVPATHFVDGISSVGLHNGVVRVALTRLLPNGQHQAECELQIPLTQLRDIVAALSRVS